MKSFQIRDSILFQLDMCWQLYKYHTENLEEAEAFLEDCMAVVVHSLDEVREYFEEEGADIDGMTREELEEASEVFPLPDGTYLIVEG